MIKFELVIKMIKEINHEELQSLANSKNDNELIIPTIHLFHCQISVFIFMKYYY